MKLVLVVLALCLTLAACSDVEERPPGGEPFGFDDWVTAIDYVLVVELAEGPQPAQSRDLAEWSGTVVAVEWQRGSESGTAPPAPGDRVDLILTDTIEVPIGARSVVLVIDVVMPDGVQRLVNVAFDSDWQPLPGSLEPAVVGLEAAAAATAVSDRRGAMLAILEDLTP